MKKTILFRADGNTSTGLGHLYRLFSLVEMLRDTYDFIFLTRQNSIESVFPGDMSVRQIPSDITIEREPEWLRSHYNPLHHILIADGYHFNSAYQKSIKEMGFSMVFIDDLAREYMYADIVVNHSPSLTEKDYKKSEETVLVLGTDFALLRPTFLALSEENRSVSAIDTVFICFGGSDPNNLTEKAVKACLGVKEIRNVQIVLGGAYMHELEYFSSLKTDKKVVVNTNLSEEEMAHVMLQCNLAIVPSSTILYELCCVKMPILSGYYVDNQERIYNGFLASNAITGMGNIDDFNDVDFKRHIENAIKKLDFSEQMMAQRKLFDGRIKERYMNLMHSLC